MRALALVALVALAPAVAAQDVPCDPEGSQVELNACAAEAFRDADAEMNRVYQQVLRAVSEGVEARVRAAQRAWLPFRDAHCDVEAAVAEGGSMQPMVRGFCLAAVTEERTEHLRGYLYTFDM